MTVENISIEVKTNAGSAANQFRSLTSALNRVRGAGRSISSGGTSRAISHIGSAAKSATGFLGKLFSSIKRIAFYRMLRTFMRELTQAFQEGLKNAYHFSQVIGSTLAPALDRISSASGQMKNQMGAAFGELLQTIEPIIIAIISLITQLMQALSALFAALGGRLTYMVADKTASSWDKAAGAAKQYKNTILGFDEINRLNDETGGGGGGANAEGGFSLEDLPDWAKKIQEAIEAGDWRAAGAALADHLNDIIDNWNAYDAGKKLGEKINNAIQFAFGFLRTFRFSTLGGRIAEFLNGALSRIDTETLGRTLVRIVTGAIDFLIGFITRIDTYQLAQKISAFITGAFDEATNWINEQDWEEIGTTIINKIGDFFKGLDVSGMAESIATFLGTAIRAAIKLLTPLNDILTKKWEEDIKGADFTETMSNLFDAIGDGLGDIVAWVREHIIMPFMNALLDDNNWKDTQELKQRVINYMNYLEMYIRGVCTKISWIIQDLGKIAKAVSEGDWKTAWDAAQQLVHDASIDIQHEAEEMAKQMTASMDESGKATTDFSALYDQRLEEVRTKTSETETSLTGFKEAAKTVFDSASSSIGSFSGDYSSFASSVVNDTNWIGDNIGALLGKLSSLNTSFQMANSNIDSYRSAYGRFMGEAVRGNTLGYASGGFPSEGELFVAREAGPELVGTINGNTAVATNNDIVEAVSSGVYNAVSSAMGGGNERPVQVRVYLDSREIRTGQNRLVRAMGV